MSLVAMSGKLFGRDAAGTISGEVGKVSIGGRKQGEPLGRLRAVDSDLLTRVRQPLDTLARGISAPTGAVTSRSQRNRSGLIGEAQPRPETASSSLGSLRFLGSTRP